MIYLYQKIETYLNRNVDFVNEVKLESKNIFEADKFIGFEEVIKEWNAPEKEPTQAELDAIIEYIKPYSAKEYISKRIAEIESQIPKITAYINANLSDDDVTFNKEKLAAMMIEYEDLKMELEELDNI